MGALKEIPLRLGVSRRDRIGPNFDGLVRILVVIDWSKRRLFVSTTWRLASASTVRLQTGPQEANQSWHLDVSIVLKCVCQ